MVGASPDIWALKSIVISMELSFRICLFLALNTKPVYLQGCFSAKVDLVIMLDSSASVKTSFSKMLSFCKNVLANADIDSGHVKVGILSFSNTAKIEFPMTRYSTKLDVFQAIDRISHISGNTNIAVAFEKVRSEMFPTYNGDRDNVSKVVMLLTDGKISNVNQSTTAKEANTTRSRNIHIYAIVSDSINTQASEISKIVTPPSTANSMDLKQCANLSSRVFNATCPEQLIIVPTLYVRKGNPVTLYCNVPNNPGHTEVFLEKFTTSTVNNISDSKYSNFTFHSMSNSDVGTYMCYAGNSTSSSQTNTSVMLKLLEGNILHNISNAEIDKKVLELRKTLEIRKNETARYRRMKVSATDDRLSSAVMGYVGVMVIVSIISLFVFFDCLSVWQYYYDT
ncbi:unnamed protein product [Mytilus edulis]|uniref:VWFA domain-containing protein n=1 Tax=Mytilus edulis TaxID=6550 RepID=A0A8S3SBV4_MYTED|nr:unnamed protein product [Mytilus edulis]